MRINYWAVGLFIVVGFTLFTGVLFLIGDRQKAFTRHLEVYTEFANVNGLVNGAKVRVSGLDAGKVKEIDVPRRASGKFRLKLEVEDKLRHIIRKDSVVSIETEGVVGDKFVLVKKGSDNAAEVQPNETLKSKEAVEMAELMDRASLLLNDVHGSVNDIRGRVDVAIDTVTDTVRHTNGVITKLEPNLDGIAREARQVTRQVNTLATDLNAGKGAAGLILRDEQTRQQVQGTLVNVKEASANLDEASRGVDRTVADFESRQMMQKVQQTLENVQATSERLNATLQQALAQDNLGEDGGSNLRQTLSNLNRSTANLAEDTEALKHNFFFRGYFKKRGFYNMDQVTPAEYRTALDKEKAPGTRVWLTASSFAPTGPGGREELTLDGRHALDGQVAPHINDMPGHIIIAEGYSTAGTGDQKYRTSQRRAELVRRYLEVHYHLRHSDIGAIPLQDTPPSDAGRENWDGAAINLLNMKSAK